MRNRSETWESIVARGEFNIETVARIYGATGNDTNGTAGTDSNNESYKEYATITAPEISHGLLPDSVLSIGNCIAGEMTFTVMTTDTIPKSAKIVIRSRPTDGTLYGEWMDFGTYWVDHRTVVDDLTTLECFDAMKMGNQAYVDNSQSLTWPKTIATVVTRIAVQMNVDIDSRTASYLINSSFGSMNIITKPNDDEVLLDVLGHIAGIVGGNWIITPENKLRFVPLVPVPDETNYLLDNDYEHIVTDQGDDIVITGGQSMLRALRSSTVNSHPAGGGKVNVPVVIGGITKATQTSVTKVTMYADQDNVYTYGTDDGIELIVADNPYATNTLCQELYARVYGITYAPFKATTCIYDPAAELGDWVVAGDQIRSVIYCETVRFDIGFKADISAPGDDELENEYPYQSFMKRTEYKLASETGKLRSEIQQTQSSILATVSETYAKNAVFQTTLSTDVIYYLASSSSTGVTTETSGWTTTLQTIDATNKYLWVYRVLTYSDTSTRTTTPKIITNYDDDGVCVGVVRLYYASNLSTAPSLPTEAVHNTSTNPLAWTINIPTNTEDYPYLYLTYEVHSGSSDIAWTTAELDTVTMQYIDDFMREANIKLTQYGVEIDAIEQNYTQKTEVRSAFALDPTNITLTAGQDQQGNPTGRITFNAGTLVVNSTNFSLDANGIMTCNGANINGDVTSINGNDKAVLSDSTLKFYISNTLKGTVSVDGSGGVALYSPSGASFSVSGRYATIECDGLYIYDGYNLPEEGYTGSIEYMDNYGVNQVLYFRCGICIGH